MLDAVLLSMACHRPDSQETDSRDMKKPRAARVGHLGWIMAIIGAVIAFIVLVPPGVFDTPDNTIAGISGAAHADAMNDAAIIRSAVEGVSQITEVSESALSAYLGYLDNQQRTSLIEETHGALCRMDVGYGTLEQLCSDIVAGMVLAAGGANDQATHAAVIEAVCRLERISNGGSLSAVLRSLAETPAVIDTEREAVALLSDVESVLATAPAMKG